MTNLELAILFHETYERLAPSFGYETRSDTKLFDPESKNGLLMVAVCGEVLDRVRSVLLAIRPGELQRDRQFRDAHGFSGCG